MPDSERGAVLAAPSPRPRAVVALAGGAEAEEGRLAGLGLDVLDVVTSGPALRDAVDTYRPDVVLLHTHIHDANPDLPRHLRDHYGLSPILLVPARLHRRAAEADGPGESDLFPLLRQAYPVALLAEAERLGCAFVAAWPPHDPEMRLVVEQALSRSSVVRDGPPGVARAARGEPAGRVIALWGLKGGVGKTAVVANVACGLGSRGRRVLVIDLDTTNSAVHRDLGITPSHERGIGAFARAVAARPAQERQQVVDLTPFVTPYRAPGEGGAQPVLDLLVGLTDAMAKKTAGQDLATIGTLIRSAKEQYDDIIIDLGATMTTAVHPRLVAEADLALVMVTPRLVGVEGTAAMVTRLTNAVKLNPARCHLVVNRVTTPPRDDDLTLTEVRAYFPTIAGVTLLPEEPDLPQPRHTPWILAPQRRTQGSALVRSLEALCNEIVPGAYPPRPRGLLERLRDRLRLWRAGRAAGVGGQAGGAEEEATAAVSTSQESTQQEDPGHDSA